MFVVGGEQAGSEFLAGWVTEYSLSIDNLFVFVLIMASFAVPRKYQQEILMIGILLAILFRESSSCWVLRSSRALAGSSTSSGLSCSSLVLSSSSPVEKTMWERENRLTFLQRRLDMTNEFHGLKFRIPVKGRTLWTPLVIVLVAIGTADVVFGGGLDSRDLRHYRKPLHRVHRERFRADGFAAAVFPARSLDRQIGVPTFRHCLHLELHRGEARHARPARQ